MDHTSSPWGNSRLLPWTLSARIRYRGWSCLPSIFHGDTEKAIQGLDPRGWRQDASKADSRVPLCPRPLCTITPTNSPSGRPTSPLLGPKEGCPQSEFPQPHPCQLVSLFLLFPQFPGRPCPYLTLEKAAVTAAKRKDLASRVSQAWVQIAQAAQADELPPTSKPQHPCLGKGITLVWVGGEVFRRRAHKDEMT